MSSGKVRQTPQSSSQIARGNTPNTSMCTRSSANVKLSKEEIHNLPYDVKDSKGGVSYLENHLLVPIGEPITNTLLSLTLLHITQLPNVPKTAIEAIRSVAFILEEDSQNQAAETISSKVVAAIAPHIGILHVTVDELKLHTETLPQSNQNLTNAITNLSSSIDDTKNTVESLKEKLDKAYSSPPSQSTTNTPSYSSIVKSAPHQSMKLQNALTRTEVRNRQVLIEPSPGESLHTPDNTNTSITDKLTKAINSICKTEDPIITIKAIILLNSRGILIELNTKEAADWIRKPQTKELLLKELDIQANIKERLYSIIVPYVPISTPLNDYEFLHTTETENNLPPHLLESARWIKPLHCCSPNQRVALAILHVSDPLVADILIRDGLYINKEKLHPQKDKKEPL